MIIIDKILTLDELKTLKEGDVVAHVFPRLVVTAPPHVGKATVLAKSANQLLIKREMPGSGIKNVRWSLITGRPVGDKSSPARLASIKEMADA